MAAAAKYLFGIILFISVAHAATTGTIDSTDKYAWSENMGWINFGTSQGSVTVTDTALTGYAWGENVGWISLNCSNTSSCATVDYSIANQNGSLSGYAWSENTGWIDFRPAYGGVSIGSTGEFTGYAWSENTGWISFNCDNTSSCATVDFKVKTDWRPPTGGGGGPVAPPPSSQPSSQPSVAPSTQPSSEPSAVPSIQPSSQPPPHVVPSSGPTPPSVSPPSSAPPGVEPAGPPGGSGSFIPAAVTKVVDQVQQSVTKVVSVIAQDLKPAAVAVANLTKKTAQPISVISGVGVGISTAAGAVSVASSGVSMFNYLAFFFKNILVFFGLKRKTRAWGTVYNAVTKQPLAYTKVQLIGSDQRVLETRVTDREGRYGFLAHEGSFTIVPSRDHFTFPSRFVTGSSDTILYPRVYNGGVIAAQPDELLKFDIPLDPVVVADVAAKKRPSINTHNLIAHISNFLFWIALIAMPLNYILHPNLINLVMLIVFAILNLFIIAGDLRQRPYGVVLDRATQQPIPYSLITLNDAQQKRKGFTVSDDQGRYFLLSDKGSYKILAYTPANVVPQRSTEESFSSDRGWIAKILNL